MRLLFFIESMHAGGKERRAVELLDYLKKKTNYQLQIVLTEEEIHYQHLLSLNIPIIIIERKFGKKDVSIFFRFFDIVKKFKPNIIHSWGAMTTFYAIPSSKYFKIPIINGQIADATPYNSRSNFDNYLWKVNSYFSSKLFANSIAGLQAYGVSSKKGVVIYNGVRLERFQRLKKSKKKINIKIDTPLSVIMVASFGMNKDYDLYLNVASRICEKRDDVTFIAVGDGESKIELQRKVKKHKIKRFLFTGRIENVEELVSICDVGLLLTNVENHKEGIPNTVIEYMALSKPVIATDAGGTLELIEDKVSGFLVNNDIDIIVNKINKLLDNPNLREQMGKKGREIIENRFTIEKMGYTFLNEYEKLV